MFRFLKEWFRKIKNSFSGAVSKFFRKNDKRLSEEEVQVDNAIDKKLVMDLREKNFPKLSQFKHLPRILTLKEKRVIYLLVALIVVSLSFILYQRYALRFPLVPVSGGEYTEGLVGAPRYINPLLAQNNDVDLDLVHLVFSGLFQYDKKLEIIPDLAKSFTVSDDQKVYTITLKNGIYWHDGAPVTSDDVVFTFESIRDPNFKSALRFGMKGVKVEKTGLAEIVFTLAEPQPKFLQFLTTGILPEHIWGKIPAINSNLTDYNIKPIGAGPWKFKSLSRDGNGNIKSFTLLPHEYYHGGKPYIKKLTLRFFQDFDQALDALNNRIIEGVSYVSGDRKNKIKHPNIRFYSFRLPQYTAIFFNSKNNERLKDAAVRKALALSIDKTAIFTEAIKLQGEIISGPLLPGFFGSAPSQKIEASSPEKAKNILDESGWKEITSEEYKNQLRASAQEASSSPTNTENSLPKTKIEEQKKEQTFRKKVDALLQIVLTTVNIPEYISAAELIKNSWRNIGVQVEIKIFDEDKIYREGIKNRSYEALLYGESYGADPDPYPFWHSSQTQDPGLNLAMYSNRNIDVLLDEARKAKTQEEKISLYQKFNETLQSEYPAIFLYSPTYTYAVHEKVHIANLDRIILPHHRLIENERWYIFSGRRWKR